MTDATTGSEPTSQLQEDIAAVMRDAEELVRAAAGSAGAATDEARAKVRESLEATKLRLKEIEERLSQDGAEALRATDDYVRRNPWQAVGIAAGVGLVVGLLLSRR
jgi:ElaB/YqjD/DUF883 family membrane-anchored ribosome-binding protein